MKDQVVTVVTPFYYPQINGVSHVAQKNVEALLDLGYKVIVLTNTVGTTKSTEKVYNFDVKGNGTLFFPISGEKKVFIEKGILCSLESSLIILHCWHSWSTNLLLDNYDKLNSKVFVYSHGTSTRSSKINLYFLMRYVNYFFESFRLKKYINLIDGLICITDNRNHYRCIDTKFVDVSKKTLVLNPIIDRNVNLDDIKKVKARYDVFFKTDLRIAFCLSNYEKIKNQKYLIDLARSNSFKLVCLGSKKTPYYMELEDYVKKNNLEDRVLLDYDRDDSTIDWLFRECSFFLFASKNDFSPLVLIESSKYGLPFISFKTADSNRAGGFFCSNEKDYEFKLSLFIKYRKEDLDKVGLEGLLFYEQNNSFENYKNEFKNILLNENMAY